MNVLNSVARSIAVAVMLSLTAPATAAGFVDVLDSPAQMSPLASSSPLQAVTKAGDRLVAVGQRGHIVHSNDGGTTWQQAKAPVSSDLTAVSFANARHGWAVGHDGVILHTGDGGVTWALQLDGRRANDLMVAAMEHNVAAEPQSENAKKLLAEAKRYKEQGADKPFLDVWFADENNGYVVGAYNLIFRTRDGGKNWEPWFDRTDNPRFFNLYAIRPGAGDVYVVGESGVVLKLDGSAQRFRALSLPYNGSFFGAVEAGSAVLVFGLRGNAYRSDDRGATWTKVEPGLPGSIVAAARTSRGGTLLADAGGRVAQSADDGRTFGTITMKQPMPLTGLAAIGEGKLAMVGPRGIALSETTPR